MCGIVGIFDPNGLSRDLQEKSLIQNMRKQLIHRGPDEEGLAISELASLGHTRLTIVDLTSGQQPMHALAGRVTIVFNGEIFNFPELKASLEAKGHRFKTTCDTEVVLQMYLEYGVDMLKSFNGQFAIGIVDHRNKSLLLARDRVGIIPLYYSQVGGTTVFGSSIRSLLACPIVRKEFNHEAYGQIINVWTTIGETTFFEDINIVPPGCFMQVTQEGVHRGTYWDLSFPEEPVKRSEEEWKEAVQDALARATEIRLRADVPVNSYLSGGLDSSVLLQLIHEQGPKQLESFSVQFTDPAFDESDYQKLMSDHTGIPNNAVQVDPSLIGSVFPKIIEESEQPIYRTAPAPMHFLSKSVREKGFKVVLSGEGADEIGYGYNIFKETLIRQALCTDPNDAEALERIGDLYPYMSQFNKRYLKFLQGFYQKSATNPEAPLFSHRIRMQNAAYLQNFLQEDIREQVAKYDVESAYGALLPDDFKRWTPLQRCGYTEMKTLLAGYLLSSQGDRMSMAHSVEARFPFLDNDVIDLFASMPDEIKLNNFNEKHIIKEAFKSNLPEQIFERRKQPYRSPEAVSLLTEELRDAYLNETTIGDQAFFKWELVEKLINKIQGPGEVTHADNFAMVNVVATTIHNDLVSRNYGINN